MTILSDDAFVRLVQGHIGVTTDGVAGEKTQAAFLKAIGAPAGPALKPSGPGEWPLDARSEKNLVGVHPDLVKVVRLASTMAPLRFMVIEGLRSVARQKKLVASGASQTMRSRHLTGHAVDIVPLDDNGQISWDWPLYHRMEPSIKQAADEAGVPIEWGGDWRTFKDAPHWQLPWRAYP